MGLLLLLLLLMLLLLLLSPIFPVMICWGHCFPCCCRQTKSCCCCRCCCCCCCYGCCCCCCCCGCSRYQIVTASSSAKAIRKASCHCLSSSSLWLSSLLLRSWALLGAPELSCALLDAPEQVFHLGECFFCVRP